MFMDTPKLQPISKSRPKTSEQQNVPSQSGDTTTTTRGSGSNNKNFGASSLANDNKGDTRNNNTNSYRKNNCGPNFPKNFKSRITGDCHPKNIQRNHLTYHNSSNNNNNNINNRPNWKNNIWNSNSNIIHWTPKFNNNNNPFRKINYTNSPQRFDSNRLNSDNNDCTSTSCEVSLVANCDSTQILEGNSEIPVPDNNTKRFNNSKRSPPKRPYKGAAKKQKPPGKCDQSLKPPPGKKAKLTHQAKPAKVIPSVSAPPPYTRTNLKQTKKTQPKPKREFRPKSPSKKPNGKQNDEVPQTTGIGASTTSASAPATTNTTKSASAEGACGDETKSSEENNSKSTDSAFSETKLANICQESLSEEVSAIVDSSSVKDDLPLEDHCSAVVNSEAVVDSIIAPAQAPAPAYSTSQPEQQQTFEISESCSTHLEIQDIDSIYKHMTNVLDYKSHKEAESDTDILLEQPQQQPTVLPTTTTAITDINCPVETQSDSDPKEFQFPKISLIPISRLIASEFWETPREESLTFETCHKTPSAPSTPNKQAVIFKPNLIKRKRNVSTCSNTSTSSNTAAAAEHIVDKLVTMNKINIKDIINNTGSKYDEALKLQARKRLREEIRRQLKSMNIEPTKDPVNSEFVPDEIVDSMNIPDFVLDEIRKVLGYDILQLSANIKGENAGPEDPSTMVNPENIVQLTKSLAVKGKGSAETPIIIDDHPTATTPVKVETVTIAAGEKTKDHKKTKRYRKHKESHTHKSGHKKRPQKGESISNEIIVLDSSSNSSGHSSSSSSSSSSTTSSSSSSSSSSSDSESDTSKKSTSSAIKRKRLKLKMDAENVVDSFEKLILPSLSDSLNERYRAKYSNSTNTKLHFISCICVSEYNSEKFSKMEVAKIQRNLKSADCSMALEFLMREIVNVFNKQKQVAKMGEQNCKSGHKQAATSEEETQQRAKEAAKQKPPPVSKNMHGGAPSPDTTKSVNAAQTPNDEDEDDNANASTIQKCVSKVLSLYRQEMKAAAAQQQQQQQQKSTVTTVASPQQATVAQHQTEDSANQHTSNTDTTSSTTLAPPSAVAPAPTPSPSSSSATATVSVTASCVKNASNGIKLHKDESAQHHLNRISQLQRETENQFNHIKTLTNLTSSDYNLLPIDTNSIRFNSSIFDFPSSSFTQPATFPALDLEMLKKQSPIGEAVVNNLREIDVKLMELHKRKMYIEEMILKLQKDKMDTDLLTIKLQNEKFILLNTAMTANVTNSTAATNATAMEKCPGNLTDTLLNLKNIKTETVEIPDDEQPPAKVTPTKRKVNEEPSAPPPPPPPPNPKTSEEPVPTRKVSVDPVTTHTGCDDTTSSSKTVDIPPSKRKSHINKVTTSGRAKRKMAPSDSTTIGETFKRLRQQAQKATSENREVSSTATKNSTPHDGANEDNENHRLGNDTHENLHSNVKSKTSEDNKINAQRNSVARNHSKTRKTEGNPQRRNSEVIKATSKTTSPMQTVETEFEEHHPQRNKDVRNQHHLKTSPLGSANLHGDVPTPSPTNTDSEVRPHGGRCYSEEKKPNGETVNGSASVSPFTNDANQPSTSTATPPLPPLTPAADPTTSQHPDEVIDMMALYKNMPCRLVEGLQSPIAQIRVFDNTILASSEDGKIYTFNASTLELMNTFNKHTEAITQMYLCQDKRFLFTTSLDGYMKKSQLENLSSGTQSVYLKEPLQTLDIQWDTAYAGSRWGNIYMCHILSNIRSASLLCSTESSIITIKAAKEGARKVLIVSSKGNVIHVRDATSGLLLRTFDVPDCINIYSILLNESILYCGTQKKEIRKYDFVSGAPVGSITCGNGAVSMLMFRNKYMFVGCYDGFIYIIDKVTGRQVTRLTGSGKMILTLEIVGDKIITSAKDTSMKVINIPTFCLTDSL